MRTNFSMYILVGHVVSTMLLVLLSSGPYSNYDSGAFPVKWPKVSNGTGLLLSIVWNPAYLLASRTVEFRGSLSWKRNLGGRKQGVMQGTAKGS